uniref:ATP synthase subunit a n=1 Tax=Chromochloris zofingiensis TaxID=31302 RepID=A0A076VFJ3_9CHLO|nr:ATP synthase F0 subunit 6 [Chromochloris zofingiensis]AIK29137.1 ATP synthase F0 subunit 6 [Chromochloris zofingiensis]
MNYRFSFFVASSAEAWQTVPLFEFIWPTGGAALWFNVWAVTVFLAVLAAAGPHAANHDYALAGTTAISSLRTSIRNFWSTQILERVVPQWRARTALNSNLTGDSQTSLSASKLTNRVVSAIVSRNTEQRTTTAIWVTVLFFRLLASNAFGLVPLCAAVTGQAGTTLGLSIALLTAITVAGIQRQGVRFVKLFLPSGPSWPRAPVFVLLESISYAFRSISLGVRLWANRLAGHQLIHLVTALALVPVVCSTTVVGFLGGVVGTRRASVLLLALSGLETIVCVLQSGVFCLLANFYLHEVLSGKDRLV